MEGYILSPMEAIRGHRVASLCLFPLSKISFAPGALMSAFQHRLTSVLLGSA